MPERSRYQPARSVSTPAEGQAALPKTISDAVQTEETDNSAPARIEAWHFAPQQSPRTVPLTEVSALIAEHENFVWVDVSAATDDELREAADQLAVDDKLIATALGPWQRPRVDIDGSTYCVIATLPLLKSEDRTILATEIDLFVQPNLLLSSSKQQPVLMGNVMERANRNSDRLREDSAYMLYIILDELLSYYEGLIEHLNNETEDMEERALNDTSDDYLTDLLRLKRYAFALSRLAAQHRVMFSTFLRADFPFEMAERAEPFFRELLDRLTTLLQEFDTARELINGAFELYTSHVAHRTNGVVRVLTLISGLLLPASLVLALLSAHAQDAQVFGQAGVIAVYLCTGLVFGITLFVFWLKGWFGLQRH